MLAGNALLMTDTKSQQYFFQENSNIGLLYKQENVTSLVNEIKNYLDSPAILENHRQTSLKLAKYKYNWEIEQQIFLINIKNTLVS
jgi:hypothetical protein